MPLQARRASREAGRLDRIQSSIRPRNGRARVVGQRRVSVAVAEGQQLPAIAARRRAALQAAASERCVVESALPLTRRRRRAPGRGQAVVPSGWSAGLGRPARVLERPARRNERGLSPGRVRLYGSFRTVAAPGAADLQWRATARDTEPRGRPHRWRCTAGHDVPRVAGGRSTRSGAAQPNCNSRTRGRRSSGGYYSSSFTQGEWSEGGGGERDECEPTHSLRAGALDASDEHPAQAAPHVLAPPVVREPQAEAAHAIDVDVGLVSLRR